MNTLVGVVINPPSNSFITDDGMLNTIFEIKTMNKNKFSDIVKVVCHGRHLVNLAKQIATVKQKLTITGEISGDFYEDARGRVFESLYIDADDLVANKY